MDLSFCMHQTTTRLKSSSLALSAHAMLPDHLKDSRQVEMSELHCSLLHDINCIRNLINNARQQEQRNATLQATLSTALQHLHHTIQLNKQGAIASLTHFVTAYIENVPNFLETIIHTAFDAGLETLLVPPLKVIIDFFLTPSSLVFEQCGLEELMEQSFFAHRLCEELNDFYRIRAGIPIVYVDMITANLIIHNIIGETQANKLERAVAFAMEKLPRDESLFESAAFHQHLSIRETQWDSHWQSWAEMFVIDQKAIYVEFTNSLCG